MSKKFLIVDDSKVSRMFIRRYLQELRPDWQLTEAGNSDEALTQVALQQFDIASIDYNMPGMSGLELAGILQKSLPQCFIGLVTANIQKSTEMATLQLGCNYYKKPISEDMIRQLILDAESHHA